MPMSVQDHSKRRVAYYYDGTNFCSLLISRIPLLIVIYAVTCRIRIIKFVLLQI